MSGSYPQPPSVRVNLNANILDCSNMKGGYSSWRLGPNGSQLSPVIQKNTAPYTTSGANALYLYGQDGAVDVYFPGSGADFNRGETITVQGKDDIFK